MAEPIKLTDQIDRLLAEHRYEDAGPWYDGREETLLEVRKLAEDHAEAQRKVEELAATFVVQAQETEDAREELSRGVLDLIMARSEQTLAEVVAEVVKEFQRTAIVGEEHVCESAEDLKELRSGIEDLISDLKGLL